MVFLEEDYNTFYYIKYGRLSKSNKSSFTCCLNICCSRISSLCSLCISNVAPNITFSASGDRSEHIAQPNIL